MKKNCRVLNGIQIGLLAIFTCASALAETQAPGLSEQLDELRLPQSAAPALVTHEQLYAAQSRETDLSKKFEINFGGARNFNSDSFLNQSQLNLALRYHLSNRWNLSVSSSYGFNSFSASADRLIAEEGVVPDTAIVNWRADFLTSYNLFYGKMRISMDNVIYFDQYVAAGPGLVNTQFGTVPAAVADVGVAIWMGRNWNARVGAKNEFFTEKKMMSSDLAYHFMGHIELGYLFGGESKYE